MTVGSSRLSPDSRPAFVAFFKNPPRPGLVPSCQEAGIIGVVAGIIGTLQATEALKLVLGIGRPLTDRLLDFDARTTQFREIRTKRNPNCQLCGTNPTITELFDHEQETCELQPPASVSAS